LRKNFRHQPWAFAVSPILAYVARFNDDYRRFGRRIHRALMSHILGIKFHDHGPVYFFNSGPFVVSVGEFVLVQTEQGLGMGQVALVRDTPPEGLSPEEIKPIFRLPGPEDHEIRLENAKLAREAHAYCRKCIEVRALDMKLVDVEVLHDRGKIIFYFTAPGRIDFRELVKDLVKSYHTRIELRQIGVRHETQMLGAIGNCGQMCCCRRFMRKFAPVTIKMAKEQNLFLNPTKISGICGRLLCCLSFEQENYEQFQKKCPRVGKKFATSLGMVKVLRTNLFRETISILEEAGEERELTVAEWITITEPCPEAAQPSTANGEARPEAAAPPVPPASPTPGPRTQEKDGRRSAPSAQTDGQEPGRSQRRGRRPARKSARQGRDAAHDQPQRQRPGRQDSRHGGNKPSRDPETGS
jgi:cell fate regulator YaaT (PSP1 superfamily)